MVQGLLWLLWFVPAVMSAVHAVMYKRDPRGAAIWVIVSFTVPCLGPVFYVTFGINRIERRAAKMRGGASVVDAPPNDSTSVVAVDDEAEQVGYLRDMRRISDRVTRLPLLAGNSVAPLHNGENAYPAMLDAIDSAKRSITLASYIFDWDEVGRKFTDALGRAANRGVRVHVLLDGIGAVKGFSRIGRGLIKSGAEVTAFFPLRFPLGRFRVNLRNHRKILVIDGKTGFTGGMNISQRHMVRTDNPRRSEDLHFRITGPVVAHLQHAFVEDWQLAARESLEGADYFPELCSTGTALCRGVSSGPDEHLGQFHWLVQAALDAARLRVIIVTPYLVPTQVVLASIVMASLRGVEVSIVLPGRTDLPYMRWVADAYLWQLMEHGVRVYRRRPPFVHTKLMIVDGRATLLGSANMDPRSFRLNFEFNVEVYDAELSSRLATWMDEVIAGADEVTLAEIDARPGYVRFRDGLVRLFAPLL